MPRLIAVLFAFFVLGGGGYAGYTYFNTPKPQTYVVCPTDLKQCKGGVGVGRISPSCEFALCPEERPEGTGGIKVLTGVSIVGSSTQTLEAIRENGGDYTCQVLKEEGIRGTVYASQGELRGDFDPVMKPNVRSVPTHLILGKSQTFVWSDAKNTGHSFVRGMEGGNDHVLEVIPLSPIEPLSVSCSVWQRDAERFTPPSDVSITDLSASSTPTNN